MLTQTSLTTHSPSVYDGQMQDQILYIYTFSNNVDAFLCQSFQAAGVFWLLQKNQHGCL